jgi:hypothetical protein
VSEQTPTWAWSVKAKNYRDLKTGRFMTRAEAGVRSNDSLSAAVARVRDATARLEAGQIDAGTWDMIMRNQIRNEYARQYMAATGGQTQMTRAAWGRVGNMVGEQNKYLGKLVEGLRDGSISPAQAMMRSGMYANSAREAWSKGNANNAKELGKKKEKWTLGDADHCEDCLAFAAMGLQPIGTFPMPGAGETRCLTACKCELEYE